MVLAVRRTDVMLKLLGAPHQTDLVTSALRLAQALLDEGAAVQVWACGDATALTWAGFGDSKPFNVTERTVDYPSTVRVIRGLLTAYPEHLDWYVCRFCCDDRGRSEQIPEVLKRAPSHFWEHVRATDKIVAMGVC